MGQSSLKYVPDNVTTSEKTLVKIMNRGLLMKYDELDLEGKKIYKYSAITDTANDQKNVMLAAFITAAARLHLNRL